MKTFKDTEISAMLKIVINELIYQCREICETGIRCFPSYGRCTRSLPSYERWVTLYLLFEEEAIQLGYSELNEIFSSISHSLGSDLFDINELSKNMNRINSIIIDLNNKDLKQGLKKDDEIKLFVWTQFEPDFNSGLAFAVAKTEEEAKNIIIKNRGDFLIQEFGDVKILEIKSGIGFSVTGGS